jgi:hypothetical protein
MTTDPGDPAGPAGRCEACGHQHGPSASHGTRFFGWGTERRTKAGRKSRRGVLSRRRPGAWPVIGLSAGAFFAAMAFLAGQVREGRDPALGPAEPVAQAKPRVVVVRRIVKRTVVHHPAPRAGSGPVPASPSPAASAPSTPAPAQPAPAPAPAAPAPLTTRSS